MKTDNYFKQIVGYLALAYLAYLFLVHGIQALISNPEFITLVRGVGISYGAAKILLYVVGIIDISIAIALFMYRKIWILIYAGLWPIVPNVMSYFVLGYFSWSELFIAPILAIIAYWVFNKFN